MKRDIFQALADPNRRAILLFIAAKPMTPNAVSARFHISRQAVSKHIQVLAESGLLNQERKGREIEYHVNVGKISEIDVFLQQFRQLLEQRFSQLDDVLNHLKNDNDEKPV